MRVRGSVSVSVRTRVTVTVKVASLPPDGG